MPLRPLPFREVHPKLIAAGFTEKGSRGSHVEFEKQSAQGKLVAIVSKHHEVVVGTIKGILRQAGLSVEEFDRL